MKPDPNRRGGAAIRYESIAVNDLAALRKSNAELLAALKEAQETLLHNGIDTGPLPGVSSRIRAAIDNASKL